MSGMSSLSAMLSGLSASQSALATTAHNLANVNTPGYVRQQTLMKDASYSTIGRNATTSFYVGLGVDVQAIRQIRDRFMDQSYRQEHSKEGFYSAKNGGIQEIETILGETEGESFATVLNNLWVSINEVSKHPEGLETRGAFIQNAVNFVERANLVSEQLISYQENLNQEVMDIVSRVNSIGDEIDGLNQMIVSLETAGGNANDYRDQRNTLLDELSGLMDISYSEDKTGSISVRAENVEFITTGGVSKMGLAPAEPFSLLVKPIWNDLNPVNNSVYNFSVDVTSENNNDKGRLKGLLLARGTRPANFTDMQNIASYEANIKPSVIMNAQAQFDQLIHGIVTMINDTISPNTVNPLAPPPQILDTANAPYGLDGSQGIEIFSRKNVARYTGATNIYTEEDPLNRVTLYSAVNIEVNKAVLDDYNKICFSSTINNTADNTVIEDILTKWKEPSLTSEPALLTQLNFDDYYQDVISGIGNVGNATMNYMENQQLMVEQIDNRRSTTLGVSSDEELSNMIKYQHSYNAAAKVVTILDQMLETIVTTTGLVGR